MLFVEMLYVKITILVRELQQDGKTIASFEVGQGDVVLLTGGKGSGKSSALKITHKCHLFCAP